ncbi:GNAT family N-acetyltransferase [Thalassotalea euphylliae]|uniref:GNAT family N-acetyltransferase n=1 Tax=Thalassotalea euphylliae TaxID=1655234 RepID=A0A3E0TXU3_9GAMM|nr:GNAT family N-acetyltransferase [Thalassotalea euphylliae]REL29299.1 GNAT family N-acetyltransferase [Thalassotalea euphylliae]
MTIEICKVDYHNAQQMAELIALLDQYAQDPMGGGEALSPDTKQNLAAALQQRNFMTSLIAYVDDQPAGLANCIESFSTFACKPILNIHDMAVNSEFRGLGLSQKLLAAVETLAREKGCSKVTLEVLSGNKVAMNAYEKFGFTGYELDPAMGKAEFWEKKLK